MKKKIQKILDKDGSGQLNTDIGENGAWLHIIPEILIQDKDIKCEVKTITFLDNIIEE